MKIYIVFIPLMPCASIFLFIDTQLPRLDQSIANHVRFDNERSFSVNHLH